MERNGIGGMIQNTMKGKGNEGKDRETSRGKEKINGREGKQKDEREGNVKAREKEK